MSASELSSFTRPFEQMLFRVERAHAPYCYRCPFGLEYPSCGLACVKNMETAILGEGPETIAEVMKHIDYVRKNRFPGVLLGLSGGIDSALTAAVAVDAVGPAKVRCVMMPSPHRTSRSQHLKVLMRMKKR